MFAFGIGLSALILILCLPPFYLNRWFFTRPPVWIYPIVFPAGIVFFQWLRGGRRGGVSFWVYEVGIAVGVYLGLILWYLRAKIARGKTVTGKGDDLDF